MGDDAEIIKEFLVESYENLDRLDQDLIALEKDPGNRDTLASIFRTIHTIKGTSGFLAFNKLEAVTHVGESLLSRLRDGLLSLNPEITTALLAMVDAVRQMLNSIDGNGSEGERDDKELIATLTRLVQPGPQTNASPVNNPTPTNKDRESKDQTNKEQVNKDQANKDQVNKDQAQASKTRPSLAAGVAVTPAAQVQPQTAQAAHTGVGASVEPSSSAKKKEEKQTVESGDGSERPSEAAPARGQSASDSTIRVDVSLLDQLMNLVGELVLARNQIVQSSNSSGESGLLATSQRLNLITTELQEGVMKTRMQPIGNIWGKFPRTVRDVALGCGKQVRIEMEGKETELDKTIIEAIKDPLTHLVRNAVDHGIESPDARTAAGKDPVGLLLLRAFHEGGQVNIEISDDGAGLDYQKIRNKAVDKALISADQAARMSEREINNLIFLPGFSTAEKVTNVSGRGVGMDVVKTNIEKIGGIVDVQSRRGQGTTVRMKIPLTLAIIPALIVTSAGDRYAIPQVSLLELVRLEGEQACKGIEFVHDAPVYRLRGKLLPLVYLNRELRTESEVNSRAKAEAAGIDFALVRDKHRQWLHTLQEVLAGKITMTPEQAGSFRDCGLGKWLYSVGLQDFGSFDQTRSLEDTHRRFHEHVREVIALKNANKAAMAQRQLEEVERLSQEIMELLSTVESKVHECLGIHIVVLQADDRQFGLVVDEINDTEEIVVKPLNKQLKSINVYAGATIMGDGRVALILDVLGLGQRARVVGETRDRAATEKEEWQSTASAGHHSNSVLLFQCGEKSRMAIQLGLVSRLEEFSRAMVEVSGDREVVQYRGNIMPLLRVSQILEHQAAARPQAGEESGSLQVVVYADQGSSVGLVVDRILDIVDESFEVQSHGARAGVLGSAVIQQHVTDILDVPGLIAEAKRPSPEPAEMHA